MSYLHEGTKAWLDNIGTDVASKLEAHMDANTAKADAEDTIYKSQTETDVTGEKMETKEETQVEDTEVTAEAVEETEVEASADTANESETVEKEDESEVEKAEEGETEESDEEPVPAFDAETFVKAYNESMTEIAATINGIVEKNEALVAENAALVERIETLEANVVTKQETTSFITFGSLLNTKAENGTEEAEDADVDAEELLKSAPEETPADSQEQESFIKII